MTPERLAEIKRKCTGAGIAIGDLLAEVERLRHHERLLPELQSHWIKTLRAEVERLTAIRMGAGTLEGMSDPQDHANEVRRCEHGFGQAALLVSERDLEWRREVARLNAEVERLTAERDEAQRDATFGTPAFQEALAASEARVSRLLEALVRIKMIANAGQKYKAGPISPKAVHAIADAALAETEDSNG